MPRTMHSTILANDLPSWAIKAFEQVDYDALNAIQRTSLMVSLRGWCSSQPQRTRDYDASQRTTPIPPELASVINSVDFSRMTQHSAAQAKNFLEHSLFLFVPKVSS